MDGWILLVVVLVLAFGTIAFVMASPAMRKVTARPVHGHHDAPAPATAPEATPAPVAAAPAQSAPAEPTPVAAAPAPAPAPVAPTPAPPAPVAEPPAPAPTPEPPTVQAAAEAESTPDEPTRAEHAAAAAAPASVAPASAPKHLAEATPAPAVPTTARTFEADDAALEAQRVVPEVHHSDGSDLGEVEHASSVEERAGLGDAPHGAGESSGSAEPVPLAAGQAEDEVEQVWDGPFGPGSADAGPHGSGPRGWTVKAAKQAKIYITPDLPVYDKATANLWFIDEQRALDAGFTRWTPPSA